MSNSDEEKMLQRLREKLGLPKKIDERAELERVFGARDAAPEQKLQESLRKKGPQVGDVAVITIKRLAFNGMGIGQLESIDTFVDGPVPGDTVKVRVTEAEPQRLHAMLLELIAPSSDRVKPQCPHFGTCSGCHIQCLNYTSQVIIKQQLVKDALARVAQSERLSVRATIRSPESFRYSLQTEWLVGKEQKRLAIGYQRRADTSILGVDMCPLLTDNLNGVLQSLHQALPKSQNHGAIKAITAFGGGPSEHDPVLLGVRCEGRAPQADKLFEQLRDVDQRITGLVLESGAKVAFAGVPEITLTPGSTPYYLGYRSKFPANYHLIKTFRDQAIQLASPTPRDRVVELEADEGLLGISMANYASEVLILTGAETSMAIAQKNAARGKNLTVTPDSCSSAQRSGILTKSRYDLAIVNVTDVDDKSLCSDLAPLEFPKLLYITNSPRQLVHDVAVFTGSEYRLRVVQPIDLYPHTAKLLIMAYFTHRFAGASAAMSKFADL